MGRRLSASAAPLLAAAVLAAAAACVAAQNSKLWGKNGERWDARSRIVDHSYAGYLGGASPPRYDFIFNVRKFGAVPDDGRDDTDAFMRAIQAASEYAFRTTSVPCTPRPRRPADSLFVSKQANRCPAPHSGFGNRGAAGATVFIPPGAYSLSRTLELTQSNVAVVGAGAGKTILRFPRGLKSIYGDIVPWAYAGGFLTIVGPEVNSTHTAYRLAELTADADKGARRLLVTRTNGIRVGQYVRLWAANPLVTRGGQRGLLATAGAAAEAGQQAALATGAEQPRRSERRLLQAASGVVPLSPAMRESVRQAEALGLGGPEYPERGAASGGVGVASADGTLDAYIYGQNAADSGRSPFPLERIRFAARVVKKGPNWIELERPLPYSLRMRWQPGVYSFEQAVQHAGYANFTVQFPWSPYPSHFDVPGFNAFYFTGAANCWASNVDVINADTAGEAINSDFITFSNIRMWHTKPRKIQDKRELNGHHGLWAAHSSNVLITDAKVDTTFIHDFTLDVWAQECVIKNSRGRDVNLDMHRGGSHNNLWSNIDVGRGSRPFASSGSVLRGAHAAANNTWWNIVTDRAGPFNIPPCSYGPLLTFVGPRLGRPSSIRSGVKLLPGAKRKTGGAPAPPVNAYCPEMRWYAESVQELQPRDLHEAMRQTRRARLG